MILMGLERKSVALKSGKERERRSQPIGGWPGAAEGQPAGGLTISPRPVVGDGGRSPSVQELPLERWGREGGSKVVRPLCMTIRRK